jgi:hypothetical protein
VRSEVFGFLTMSNSDVSSVDSDDSSGEEDHEPGAHYEIRQGLSETTLEIQWEEDYERIFAHVDTFLELSRGNTIVQKVILDPYWYNNSIRRSDANWKEKLGRALGNLQSLKVLQIAYIDDTVYGEEEEPPICDMVARVLQHVRQKITLSVRFLPAGGSEEAFASAIHEHPTIQRFETVNCFQFHSFGILASALASLPALESTDLGHAYLEEEDGEPLENLPAMEHPEHMTTLLL